MIKNELATKVVTGKVRLSYVRIWEAESISEGDKAMFSVSLIIPKSDKKTLNAIKEAIENAKEVGKSKLGGRIPPNLKTPLRDGDEERPDDEAYADSMFLNAKSYSRPGIVDRARRPIMDPDEVYSGCYAAASITFYAYNFNGSKGVACGLNHIMKLSDGEPLGGRSTAESDFANVEFDDDLM